MYGNMEYDYNQQDTFDADSCDVVPYDRMIELGFEPVVMQTRDMILQNYGKLSTRAFEMFGIWNYKLRQDVLYADKIIKGLIPIENKIDLKKHLQKMGFERKISIADLSCSMSPKNELRAVIKGLPQKSLFGVYNTNVGTSIAVDTLTNKYITILSEKYYKISARQSKKLYRVRDTVNNRVKYYDDTDKIEKGILDNTSVYKVEKIAELLNIQTIGDKKYVSVMIHRDYCRLVGRYMIVASLKAPDIHLGAYELISLGATTVYVFAKQVKYNQKADIKYSTGAERVYYIGHEENKLDEMLTTVANQIYQTIRGVYSEKLEPTAVFENIEPWVSEAEKQEQLKDSSTLGEYEIGALSKDEKPAVSSSTDDFDDDW